MHETCLIIIYDPSMRIIKSILYFLENGFLPFCVIMDRRVPLVKDASKSLSEQLEGTAISQWATLLFLTGMCEYKIEGNGSFLRLN